MKRLVARRWAASLAALGLTTACYSGVELPANDEAGDGTGDTGDTAGDGDGDELPAPSPRFYRLTHAQWELTVQDLFGLDAPTGQSELFRDDPQVAGFIFDNDATALEVDEALWTGYRIAAGAVAEQVTTDPEALARLTPAVGPSEAERIDEFVRSFGERAYRRPLSPEELTELTALFADGPALHSEVQDPFVAGIRHVVETVLQSPYFLYRIERSEELVDGLIPLDDYELASRLSYFLWNTMPDEQLFAAAAAGQLHTEAQIAAELERMLADPRAAETVVNFHHHLLEADKFGTIDPSDTFFPDAPANLAELAAEEHERFIRDVIFAGEGGLLELLTSTETFVDAALAAIYGVQGVIGDAYVHVELDPGERRGVFTHVGFLAANSTSVDPDPIHRGVFLAKRMSCLPIAAPPDGVPPLPPLEPDQTNRERVEAHTSAPQCASCHATLINPYGFPFESYDALGQWRTTDNGKPVDTATEPLVGAEIIPVSGALELVDALAQSEAVHDCYVQHWIEYANGRNTVGEDDPMIERLGAESLASQQSLQELLIAVATSPAFLNRAAQELP